jgi:hypothetical protein
VPVDWEDHQARPEPHATLLTSAAGATVPAAPSTLDVSGATIKAFRSVRVNVDNFGANACDVTCFYSMDGSAAGIGTFSTQSAPAGTQTSLLFQSQGHNLDQVSFSGVGGSTSINYEIAPSSLDPLPPSAAGDLPWTRRRKLGAADQTVPSATEPTVTWNSTHNDYPAVFAAGALGIQVLEDGLYSILVHLFLNTVVGNFPFETYVSNIESDVAFRYSQPAQFPLFSGVASFHTIARLTAGHDIYVTCRQESGVDWTLAGNDGCYFELVRLGDATVADSFG